MTYRILCSLLLCSIIFISPVSASAPLAPRSPKLSQVQRIPQNTTNNLSEETLKGLISKYAQKYGVSATLILNIIQCENPDYDPDLQSRYYLNGEREKSFGLVQINLPSWQNTTYENAIDPDYSLDFLAKKLSEGKGHLWSCYNRAVARSG